MRGFKDLPDTLLSALLIPAQQKNARFCLGEMNALAPYAQAALFELLWEGVTGTQITHHLDQQPLLQVEARCSLCSGRVS